MEFERIARRFNLQTKTNSIREIIHIMASMGVINKDDEKALFEITTIRNVIAHGQYDKNVDRSADEQLKKITAKIKKHIEDNNLTISGTHQDMSQKSSDMKWNPM